LGVSVVAPEVATPMVSAAAAVAARISRFFTLSSLVLRFGGGVEPRLDDRAQHSDRSTVDGDRARGGLGRAVGVEGPAFKSDRCCLIVAEQRQAGDAERRQLLRDGGPDFRCRVLVRDQQDEHAHAFSSHT
jgi:hypothetical protein